MTTAMIYEIGLFVGGWAAGVATVVVLAAYVGGRRAKRENLENIGSGRPSIDPPQQRRLKPASPITNLSRDASPLELGLIMSKADEHGSIAVVIDSEGRRLNLAKTLQNYGYPSKLYDDRIVVYRRDTM